MKKNYRKISLILAIIIGIMAIPMKGIVYGEEQGEGKEDQPKEGLEIYKGDIPVENNNLLIADFALEEKSEELKEEKVKDEDGKDEEDEAENKSKSVNFRIGYEGVEADLENIAGLKLESQDGNKDIEINNTKKTMEIEGGRLKVTPDKASREKLSRGYNSKKHEKTAAGNYKIYLVKKDGSKSLQKIVNNSLEDKEQAGELRLRDKPWVEESYPVDGDRYFSAEDLYKKLVIETKVSPQGDKDEEEEEEQEEKEENQEDKEESQGEEKKIIKKEIEGYFIQFKFHDLEGLELGFNSSSSSVRVQEEFGENLVDTSQDPILKGSRVYIKLKEAPEDGKEYKISLEENGLVGYSGFNDHVNSRNKAYSSSFKTYDLPRMDKLYEGSVVENYDSKYPIVIEGREFDRRTEVYFRDGWGHKYWADDVVFRSQDDDKQRLYIYLPKGRDKLEVGSYSIVIRNGRDFSTETEYGVFSVVGQGEFIPEEGYMMKYKSLYGDVHALRVRSENILFLDKSNTGRLTIDLDQAMGVDTLTRVIELNHLKSIDLLNLESQWGNIQLRGLIGNNKTANLRTGRVEPFVYKMVKDQITSSVIKSDIIELRGENFGFSELKIEIPYKDSPDGQNLRMVRYDETMGNFENITVETDRVNKKVIGRSRKPGIFLLVE